MATVAAVYSVDPHVRAPEEIVAALFRDDLPDEKPTRPEPQFKRLSAHFPETHGEGDEAVVSTAAIEAACWIAEEVELRRQKGQSLLMLIDGDHRLWDTSHEHLAEDTVAILDIVHVSSYVLQVADVLCDSPEAREKFTRSRLPTILQRNVKSVIRGIRHMATSRHLKGDQLKTVSTTAAYFEAHAARMRYDEYLAAGYPIATEVIEGACRHLVKDRMERSGMRWTLEGAKAMLDVRAVHESDSWGEFHTVRRKTECERFHPHRQLLAAYRPLHLAC